MRNGVNQCREEFLINEWIEDYNEELRCLNDDLFEDNISKVLDIISFETSNIEISSADISGLFDLADEYKGVWEYLAANEIFWILFDYAVNNPESWIQIQFETDSYTEHIHDLEYCYYYDLAVLEYAWKYMNIPIPLLSIEAARILFSKWIDFIDRQDHNREIKAFDYEQVTELNERYFKINVSEASWVLKGEFDEPHKLVNDLQYSY